MNCPLGENCRAPRLGPPCRDGFCGALDCTTCRGAEAVDHSGCEPDEPDEPKLSDDERRLAFARELAVFRGFGRYEFCEWFAGTTIHLGLIGSEAELVAVLAKNLKFYQGYRGVLPVELMEDAWDGWGLVYEGLDARLDFDDEGDND